MGIFSKENFFCEKVLLYVLKFSCYFRLSFLPHLSASHDCFFRFFFEILSIGSKFFVDVCLFLIRGSFLSLAYRLFMKTELKDVRKRVIMINKLSKYLNTK